MVETGIQVHFLLPVFWKFNKNLLLNSDGNLSVGGIENRALLHGVNAVLCGSFTDSGTML